MIEVEGYKMFRGLMKITHRNYTVETIEGNWLYKPEYDCWYCKGRSYPAFVCEVLADRTN